MLFLNDIFFLIPELTWLTIIVCLLLISTTFLSNVKVNLIAQLAFLMIFSIVLLALLYSQLPVNEFSLFNYQYLVEPLSSLFKLVFLFILALLVYVGLDYFYFERIFFVEYFFLVGFFCLSAFLLVSSNDLMVFYLAIELQSLILYTLAALKRYNVFSTESGLKYFVLGAFSSGLLLFGISLFYGFYGTLNFFDAKFLFLGWFATNTYLAVAVGVIFFLSAILFKLAAAPFHVWAPDVYEGAPTPVVALFATLPKLALFVFLTKFFLFFIYEYANLWYSILFFSGLFSVLLGTVAALNQLNIKRLYAYSAIVNVGYLVTAISFGTFSGFVAMFNYLFVYIASTLSIFLVILMFRAAFGARKTKHLPDYKMYATFSTLFGLFLSLVFFSLAGVPPLAGFFIKFFLFKTIFASDFMLNPALFIVLVTSVVSAFYYIRVVRFIFFDTKRAPQLFLPLDLLTVFSFVVLIFFIIFFFLFQQVLLMLVTHTLSLLFF